MVNHLQTSLSDMSVHAGTVLASWAKIDGLVSETDAIAFLADKRGARARAHAKADDNDEASMETEVDVGETRALEDDRDFRAASSSVADEPPSSNDDLYL